MKIKIKMTVYADSERIIEIDDIALEGLTEAKRDRYIYEQYVNQFIDEVVESDFEIVK